MEECVPPVTYEYAAIRQVFHFQLATEALVQLSRELKKVFTATVLLHCIISVNLAMCRPACTQLTNPVQHGHQIVRVSAALNAAHLVNLLQKFRSLMLHSLSIAPLHHSSYTVPTYPQGIELVQC